MRAKKESFDWTWKKIGELRTQKMGEKEEKSISLVKGYHMSFWIQSTWDRKGSMSMSVCFRLRERQRERLYVNKCRENN